jgi:hemoglobin
VTIGKKDIEGFEDVKRLVGTFYGKGRRDDFLTPVFDPKIKDRLPEQLEEMYRFWQTVFIG